jgi:hypothetical protein
MNMNENKTINTPAITLSIYHALRKRRTQITNTTPFLLWHAVAQLVEALHYKSEGRGFDSRW